MKDIRCGLRKITKEYKTDHILDNIDIKQAIEKNRVIEKINEELFIYNNSKTPKKSPNLIDWKTITFELPNFKEVPASDYFCEFKKIGEGAYGVVYSAYDKKMMQRVALKVIKIP